jgi:hypothetical protein
MGSFSLGFITIPNSNPNPTCTLPFEEQKELKDYLILVQCTRKNEEDGLR